MQPRSRCRFSTQPASDLLDWRHHRSHLRRAHLRACRNSAAGLLGALPVPRPLHEVRRGRPVIFGAFSNSEIGPDLLAAIGGVSSRRRAYSKADVTLISSMSTVDSADGRGFPITTRLPRANSCCKIHQARRGQEQTGTYRARQPPPRHGGHAEPASSRRRRGAHRRAVRFLTLNHPVNGSLNIANATRFGSAFGCSWPLLLIVAEN